MNVAYLLSKPPPTQGLHLELLLNEVDNIPQLTLCLIVIILEPISYIVILFKVNVKKIVPRSNPWSVKKKKLMSSLVNKLFTCAIAGMHIFIICIRWRRVASSWTFGTTRAIVLLVVVGDIRKLACKTAYFTLGGIFVDLVLPGNLRKQVEYRKGVKRWTVTLSKSSREVSLLSRGMFSESNGSRELERLGMSKVCWSTNSYNSSLYISQLWSCSTLTLNAL